MKTDPVLVTKGYRLSEKTMIYINSDATCDLTFLDLFLSQKPLGRFWCRKIFRHTPWDERKQHMLRAFNPLVVNVLAVSACLIGQFTTIKKGEYQ